jgi:hypothetical protein
VIGMVCGAAGYIEESLYNEFNAKDKFKEELNKLDK